MRTWAGSVEVQDVQFRESGLLVEGLRQHLGSQARSAHPEHHRVGKMLSLDAVGEVLVIGDISGGGAAQPAEPFVLVVPGPDRFVVLPEPAYLARRAPGLRARLDRLAELAAQCQLLPVDAAAEHRRALVRHRAVQLVGGVGEQFHAVLDQIGGDGIERDAGLLELGQHAPCVLDILLQTVAQPAMVAEGVERGRRHGIDGVGTDQLLDIEHVAIVLVLGAGGGPQQSLRPCASGGKPVPARAGKQPLVFLIGELGVGDRHLALQRGEPLLFARVIGLVRSVHRAACPRRCRCG